MLDSTRIGEDRGELDRDRLMWLDAELGAAPDRPTLLALHHPPLSTGSPAWDDICLPAADRNGLGEVVSRHPQVRRIVGGSISLLARSSSPMSRRVLQCMRSLTERSLLTFSRSWHENEKVRQLLRAGGWASGRLYGAARRWVL